MYIASCFGALRYVGIFIEVSFCIGVVLNHMPIGPTKPKQLDKIAFKADPGLQCYQCYDKEKVDDDWRGRHETKIDLCHVDFYKMRFETCKLDENMNALNESALVKHACVAEYYHISNNHVNVHVTNRRCVSVKYLKLVLHRNGLRFDQDGGCEDYKKQGKYPGRFCYCFEDGCNQLMPEGGSNTTMLGREEKEASRWLEEAYTPMLLKLIRASNQMSWNYNVDLDNKEAEMAYIAANKKFAEFNKDSWKNHIQKYNYNSFKSPQLKRRFQVLSKLGTAALDEDQLAELINILSSMKRIYGTGKVCPLDKRECNLETEGLGLNPDLEKIMSKPTKYTYEELSYVWQGWRNATGRIMRESYMKYIHLSNTAAVANNLKDGKEMWLYAYKQDDENFENDLESIWQKLRPLYVKLHGYVRHRLRQHWGNDTFGANEPIPAHILGNMWAQAWTNTLPITLPFKNAANPFKIVNKAMKDQNYNARKMFELSNSFYLHMGFNDMQMCYNTTCGLENTKENKECFKNTPLIEKPDWNVMCHASAWAFDYSKSDFRVKMCTNVYLKDLVTIHHEMGHIQYYTQVKDLPMEFRGSANPGFHEAVGDTIALAVNTPAHLKSIGLLVDDHQSFEADINQLFTSALHTIVFLPFAYTVDQFRWALFNGTINTNEMNFKWWELRERYQGITPPVHRSEEDMDAGAKMHVASDVEYIRYFVAHILQYEFYRQMCIDSGQYTPMSKDKLLHRCDFSIGKSPKFAAEKMIKLLKAGSSQPWPEVLEKMTGNRKMDTMAITEYFAPLEKWLDTIVKRSNIPLGWSSTFQNFF